MKPYYDDRDSPVPASIRFWRYRMTDHTKHEGECCWHVMETGVACCACVHAEFKQTPRALTPVELGNPIYEEDGAGPGQLSMDAET